MEKIKLNRYMIDKSFIYPDLSSLKALNVMKEAQERATKELIFKVLSQLLKRDPTDHDLQKVSLPERSRIGGHYFVYESITLGMIYLYHSEMSGPGYYDRNMEYGVRFEPNEKFK